MSTTTFDELVLRERRLVWWAILWRGLLVTICSSLGGGLAGFLIGFIVGVVDLLLGHNLLGSHEHVIIQVLSGLSGLVIGLAVYWQYIRWLFRARLGGFRLLLIRDPPGSVV